MLTCDIVDIYNDVIMNRVTMQSDKRNKTKKDSIRVTLRISEECSEKIEWLARRNRITQKQTFDKISHALLIFSKPDSPNRQLLSIFKDSIKQESQTDKIRKAQLISVDAYKVIKTFSKRHGVSRDVLVEKAISLLCDFAKEDTEKNKAAHEDAKKIVDHLWRELEESEKEIKQIVGEDDPILNRLGIAISVLMNLSGDIQKELDEGIPVDPEGM